MIDLDALESAAKAAPAGPYREGLADACGVTDADSGHDRSDDIRAYGGHLIGESMPRNVRAYLIAASPDVVLELIDRQRTVDTFLEELEARLRRIDNTMGLLVELREIAKAASVGLPEFDA